MPCLLIKCSAYVRRYPEVEERSLVFQGTYGKRAAKTGKIPFPQPRLQLKPGFHQRVSISIRTYARAGMAHLSQFSIPALLNPMINKMSDEASAILLLICSHEVWVKVTYDWFTACAYACAYVEPVFISQSYDISIITTTRRLNLSVFIILTLLQEISDP